MERPPDARPAIRILASVLALTFALANLGLLYHLLLARKWKVLPLLVVLTILTGLLCRIATTGRWRPIRRQSPLAELATDLVFAVGAFALVFIIAMAFTAFS
jgi:hypothetical protein